MEQINIECDISGDDTKISFEIDPNIDLKGLRQKIYEERFGATATSVDETKGQSMLLPNNFNHQIYHSDLPVLTYHG